MLRNTTNTHCIHAASAHDSKAKNARNKNPQGLHLFVQLVECALQAIQLCGGHWSKKHTLIRSASKCTASFRGTYT